MHAYARSLPPPKPGRRGRVVWTGLSKIFPGFVPFFLRRSARAVPLSRTNNHPINEITTMTTAIQYAPAQAPADIILSQLGGAGRLTAMIGAKNILSDNDGQTLLFKFAGSKKANHVCITLTPADLYDVEFKKIGRMNTRNYEAPVTDVASFAGVDATQLREIFESTTGVYLSI